MLPSESQANREKNRDITIEKSVSTQLLFFSKVLLFFADEQSSTPHVNEPDS
jgi:hypothetical protein